MSYTKSAIPSVIYPSFKTTLPSMKSKTVLITGTTSGTGKVAAYTVAELGAKLLVLNRSSERAQKFFAELTAKFPESDLHNIECDLQSFASVRKAVENIKEICTEGIHVLCNNAGVMALPDEATEDGFDVQMQTNHLSHFLLTCELLPLLEKAAESSGEARIVNHSSVARMNPKKQLLAKYLEKNGGNLGGNSSSMFLGGARWVRYNQTKLANCAFTAALHHKLQNKGSKIKALVAHPGLANTDLQVTSVKEGGMGSFFTGLFMKTSQSAEDGAVGILSCMCKEGVRSGEFHGPGKSTFAMKGLAEPFLLESFYDNEATRELLWTKSCAAVGQEYTI